MIKNKKLTIICVFELIVFLIGLTAFTIFTKSLEDLKIVLLIAVISIVIAVGAYLLKIPELFLTKILFFIPVIAYFLIALKIGITEYLPLLYVSNILVVAIFIEHSWIIETAIISDAFLVLNYIFFRNELLKKVSPEVYIFEFLVVNCAFITLFLLTKNAQCYIQNNEKITKEANEAKIEAELAAQAKTYFLANMSHEIRTPMNAITGMTEMLLREDINEKARENANNIKSACSSLLAIINDILDFSKIDSGKMEIVPTKYQMTSEINDIVNMISVRINFKKVDFLVEIDGNMPNELIGDGIRFRQILLNLLGNAVKFTEKGYIKLSIKSEANGRNAMLTVSVSDTGIGIKEKDLEKLFSNFQQVDTRRNHSIEGTGLGLSICKRLLDIMQGKITVESEYGKGSTFTFTLPQLVAVAAPIAKLAPGKIVRVLVFEPVDYRLSALKNAFSTLTENVEFADDTNNFKQMIIMNSYTHIFIANEQYSEVSDDLKELPQNTKVIVLANIGDDVDSNINIVNRPVYSSLVASILNDQNYVANFRKNDQFYIPFTAEQAKILIVDDNIVNLKVAEGLMKPYNMQITTASSGNECLKLLDDNYYDIIFMDHMMPELDGIDTLKLIRKRDGDYFKNVPIIALTANAVSGVREMFMSEGFNDYLTKPIEIAKLERAIKSHLPKQYINSNKMAKVEERKAATAITIPGVDVNIGMMNCMNNEGSYLEILDITYADGLKKLELIKKLYDERDIKNLTVEIHAVKSVAASVGAIALSDTARDLEYAGRHEDINYIDSNFEAVYNQYKDFINSLMPFHRHTENTSVIVKDVSDEELERNIADLKNYLDGFDSENALQTVNSILSYNISDELRNSMNECKKFIEMYDYDSAISILN